MADPQPQTKIDSMLIDPQPQVETGDTMLIAPIPTTPPATAVPPLESTPIKIGSSTTLPFTTNQKYRVESCSAMGEEVKKYLVGPMPTQQFLDDFFPTNELQDLHEIPLFTGGCYGRTIAAERETDAYKPFVSPSDL
jgi:hypothetical protein